MPTKRILTPKDGAMELLERAPSLHFDGKTKRNWQSWRRTFGAALMRPMGERPEATPLRAQTLERVKLDGYTREKVIFNCDAFSSLSAYVLIPDGASPRDPRPGILAAHGHGNGK